MNEETPTIAGLFKLLHRENKRLLGALFPEPTYCDGCKRFSSSTYCPYCDRNGELKEDEKP